MRQSLKAASIALVCHILAACSSGSDSSESSTASSSAFGTLSSSSDFSALPTLVDDFSEPDVALLIGDSSGILYNYEKGEVTINTQLRLASANKWITGATLWRLVERGVLNRDDRPQEYIDFWTNDASDPRSAVTLDYLLGLTSGFNNSPIQAECIGNPLRSLYECVQSLYEEGLDTTPGSTFSYGPEHFQMGALMGSAAAGISDFRQIMASEVFEPLSMSSDTGYQALTNDNARYSGGLLSTAADYAKFLQALLAGTFITDMDGFIEDRTANVSFEYRPEAAAANNLDWHYAFGFWKECDAQPYEASCDEQPIISSPGAFGFTPWVDLARGYWGIIAFENLDGTASTISVQLEQQVQAEIEKLL